MSKYIDAELLKQILKPREWGTPDERWVPEHEIGAMLDYFPAADVQEVRHGRWELYDICSVCGVQAEQQTNYCPNCGSRMDKEENE